jgi:hypothetical protein
VQKDTEVLVTGLARDTSKRLPSEILRLEKELKKTFSKVYFFIVESDSTDETIEKLSDISQHKSNFKYISLGKLQSKIPNRIERLTYCRNVYVDQIRNNIKYKKCEFTVIVDFDIKNNRLDLTALKDMIEDKKWSGLFANQSGLYYDIYALRSRGWCEVNCFEEYEFLASQHGRKVAKEIAIWSKMKRIPKKSALIKVDSAFGGLGIYRTNVFNSFDYSAITNNYDSSEHVILNKKIVLNGGKLFIVPSMTNFSWNAHNLSRYSLIRKLDRGSKSGVFRFIRSLMRNLLH